MIYLDNAATSHPKAPCVLEAINAAMANGLGNPGRGAHRLALRSLSILNRTRAALAKLVGSTHVDRFILTSSATEALNLGIKGMCRSGDHVISSVMDHNAVLRPLAALVQTQVSHTLVRADSQGRIDLEDLSKAIRPNTRLAVFSHASNVVGTIQPIAEIGRIVHDRGVSLLVDTAQSAGSLPIGLEALACDMLAVAGHKGLGGPVGTGALYVRPGLNLAALIHGGTGTRSDLLEQPQDMPAGYESGTPNVLGFAGLLAALEELEQTGIATIREHEIGLIQRLLDGLGGISQVRVPGPALAAERASVVSLVVEGWEPSDLATVLDESFDMAVRAGLHCAPMAHRAMGTFPNGMLRVSPGRFNTSAEIDAFVEAIRSVV
jgi:cysteine desulfurase family protein